jgi:mycothiol synthase
MDSIHLAFVDGQPAGFAFSWILGSGLRPWAMMKVGVLPEHRRRGIGRALLARVEETLDRRGPLDRLTSLWQPEPDGEAFCAALGFGHECWFWLMERPRGAPPPAPQWPAGITTRPFDGSDRMLADWTDAYNGSFIDHWRHVPSTVEDARRIAEAPDFSPDCLLLAYRGDTAVGFCRCERYPRRGEVGVLGTIRAARGIGLGRALLRWGVGWLEADNDLPVTLIVQGENERALALYRSEGFVETRTRRVFARVAPPA